MLAQRLTECWGEMCTCIARWDIHTLWYYSFTSQHLSAPSGKLPCLLKLTNKNSTKRSIYYHIRKCAKCALKQSDSVAILLYKVRGVGLVGMGEGGYHDTAVQTVNPTYLQGTKGRNERSHNRTVPPGLLSLVGIQGIWARIL